MRRTGTITGRKIVDARSYAVHPGRGIPVQYAESNSAFYQSKGRVDGSLDEPMRTGVMCADLLVRVTMRAATFECAAASVSVKIVDYKVAHQFIVQLECNKLMD